jgi:hypothetical protein
MDDFQDHHKLEETREGNRHNQFHLGKEDPVSNGLEFFYQFDSAPSGFLWLIE